MEKKITLYGSVDTGKTNVLRCLIYLLSKKGTYALYDTSSTKTILNVLQSQKDVHVAFLYNGLPIAISTYGDVANDVRLNWGYFYGGKVTHKYGDVQVPDIPELCTSPCRNSGGSLSEEHQQSIKYQRNDIKYAAWMRIEELRKIKNLPKVSANEITEFSSAGVFWPNRKNTLGNVQMESDIAVAKFIKTQIDELIKL